MSIASTGNRKRATKTQLATTNAKTTTTRQTARRMDVRADMLYACDKAVGDLQRNHDAFAGLIPDLTPGTLYSIEISDAMIAVYIALARIQRARLAILTDGEQIAAEAGRVSA